MTLECDAKFEEKMTFGLENDMMNLTNFHQSIWNSQNWNFHWILLYNLENVWASNLRGGAMHCDNDKWCKIWNGIDLLVQKWQEKFNKFWPEHSKISKICTLWADFDQNVNSFESIPHPSCYITSWKKLTMGQLLLFFLCNFSSLF